MERSSSHFISLHRTRGPGQIVLFGRATGQDMGLRYFDRVVVVSAGRFTEMEAHVIEPTRWCPFASQPNLEMEEVKALNSTGSGVTGTWQAVLRGELERHNVPYYMVRTKARSKKV